MQSTAMKIYQGILVEVVRCHEPLVEALIHQPTLNVESLSSPLRTPPSRAQLSREDAYRLGDLLAVKLDLDLIRTIKSFASVASQGRTRQRGEVEGIALDMHTLYRSVKHSMLGSRP